LGRRTGQLHFEDAEDEDVDEEVVQDLD